MANIVDEMHTGVMYSRKGIYAGMSDKEVMDARIVLLNSLDRVDGLIEDYRTNKVVSSLGAKSEEVRLFGSWASASVQAAAITDSGLSRALALTEVNQLNDLEHAILVGDHNRLPGYNAPVKGSESSSIKALVIQAQGMVSAASPKDHPQQLGVVLGEATKTVEQTLAQINTDNITPATRELAQRGFTRDIENGFREILEAKLGAGHEANIDKALSDFSRVNLPQFDTDYGANPEYKLAFEKQERFKDGMDEAAKVLGPGHPITIEYNRIKGKYDTINISPKELAKQGAGIVAPEHYRATKKRLMDELAENKAGSESLPYIRRVMELPGFIELTQALGYPRTVEGSSKVLRYMSRYPEQSAKVLVLNAEMMRDPILTKDPGLRRIAIRLYLENQVNAGEMKNQMLRTKASVSDWTTNKARRMGYTDVQIGRIRQGIQGFVETSVLDVPKVTAEEILASFSESITGNETASELKAKSISFLKNNHKDMSTEGHSKFVQTYLPALIQTAKNEDKAEESRIEDANFDRNNKTDLLTDPTLDEGAFGTDAFDIYKPETDEELARSVNAHQDMVDVMGPPLTQGEGLGKLAYQDAIEKADAGLLDSVMDKKKPVGKKKPAGKAAPAAPAAAPAAPAATKVVPPPVVSASSALDDLVRNDVTVPAEVNKTKTSSSSAIDALLGM